jgi:hypothetical protein
MIMWVCDGCGKSVEQSDINAPDDWATIKTVIGMRTGDDGTSSEWENDHAAALCNICRGGSGQALEVRAERILRAGFKTDGSVNEQK